MAISASFIYNAAKFVMLGRGSLAGQAESIASLSLSASASIRAAIILESHTPDSSASTTTSLRLVFASRALAGTVTFISQSADMLLVGANIISTAATTVAFDASDGATPSVSTGQSIGGILIYKSVGGIDATSMPIALIDIGSPVTTNGASININWDNGVNRIFALT